MKLHFAIFAMLLMIVPVGAKAAKDKGNETAAAKPAAAQPALPPPEAQIILIRSALIALSQANQTNNYSVLSGLASPAFRSKNSPAQLSQAFAQFRSNNIDLAPVSFVVPNQRVAPVIQNGKLRLAGVFPTQPMQVIYDLSYEQFDGRWMLSDLAVNLQRQVAARQ